MKIRADSYITNTTVYRLSNLSYGVAVLALVSLLMYGWLATDENQAFTMILGVLVVFAGMIGRIASISSGNYYQNRIKDKLKISENIIELASEVYSLENITLLKFNINKFEYQRPFLYQYILKDFRNMIKFKSGENIVQIHFKCADQSENDYLKGIRQKWLKLK